MDILVCVGSACHKRGSYPLHQELRRLVEKHEIQDLVTVNVAFCLGHCGDGITMKIDDEFVTGVSADNIDVIFEKRVLGALKG